MMKKFLNVDFMDSRQLLAEALRLSDEERAALAGELIQSLETEVDTDAEAAWSTEIIGLHSTTTEESI